MIIAPSLLSADFANLARELHALETAGVPWAHLDVMDGRFVPNITLGPPVIRSLRKVSKLFFDVHLMVEAPERYLDDFVSAGADMLVVHAEATRHLQGTLAGIRRLGVKAGVALNPATPLAVLEHVLDDVDMVLVMSVNPGFSGQAFIPATYAKLRRLREMLVAHGGADMLVQVDGGVDVGNIGKLAHCGMTVAVSGSAFFSAASYAERLQQFLEAAAVSA